MNITLNYATESFFCFDELSTEVILIDFGFIASGNSFFNLIVSNPLTKLALVTSTYSAKLNFFSKDRVAILDKDSLIQYFHQDFLPLIVII